MTRLTRRYIINSLENLSISAPLRYERYYINDNLRVQKKGEKLEKEILDNNNIIISKEIISEEEFNKLKQQAYSKIIRDSYLVNGHDNISIKKYLDNYEGLIRVEVSFNSKEDMDNYQKEIWMGKEITDSPLAFDKYLSKLSTLEFNKELERLK